LSILALIGWVFDITLLAGVNQKFIPMAPGTAIIFIVLAAALLARPTRAGRLAKVLSSASVFIFLLLNLQLNLERFIVLEPRTLGAVFTGRIAPLTLINFILMCVSLFLLGLKRENRFIEGLAATGTLIVSAAVLTGYLFGLPFFYGGSIIPMALNTGLAFLCLSLAAIFTIGPDWFPLKFISGHSARPLMLRWFTPIFFFSIVLQGYIYTLIPADTVNFALYSFVMAIAIVTILGLALSYVARLIGSELDQAQRQIIESEEKFRTLADCLIDALFICDAAANIAYANAAALAMFGYANKEELIGKSDLVIVPKELRERHRQGIEHLLKTGQAKITGREVELNGLRKNGSIFPIAMTISTWPANNRTYFGAIIKDITARQLIENDLKSSEVRFKTLSEQSPNMIFINHKGKVVYANKKCEEITGYSLAEILSPAFDFRALNDPGSQARVEAAFEKHKRGEEVNPYEYTLVKKNGEKLEAVISTRLIDYDHDKAILGVVTDISELKKAETAMKMRYEELEIFKDVAVGRELKMIELEKEIDALLTTLGRPKKYGT
jgi:PAS domain S-box-containing protein